MKILSNSEYAKLVKQPVVKAEPKLVKDLRAKNAELTEQVSVLRKSTQSAKQLAVREAEVEAKEAVVAAKQKAATVFEEEIKALTKKAEEAKDGGYKLGYADGVADGLRKIHEITADDRRNLASIAALAAASHNNGAAEKIAEKVLNNVAALPEGK